MKQKVVLQIIFQCLSRYLTSFCVVSALVHRVSGNISGKPKPRAHVVKAFLTFCLYSYRMDTPEVPKSGGTSDMPEAGAAGSGLIAKPCPALAIQDGVGEEVVDQPEGDHQDKEHHGQQAQYN